MQTLSDDSLIIAVNPATGAELGRINATPPEAVAGLVSRSRSAQEHWARASWPLRRDVLRRWHAILARDADALASLIRDEIGKPIGEAMAEVVTTLDMLRWTIRNAGRALAESRLPRGWQRGMLIPPARLCWRPIGVIGILGTWNYPLFLTAPTIADALAAGNGVVWKPSEQASLLGARLDQSLKSAGFPDGLVAAVQGGPEIGRALLEAPIDKGHFTGGIVAGRRVLTTLAERGIPATVELSGFDAAIVMPDAHRKTTSRCLTWAAFVGAGQTCAAVKRVYVIGDAEPWADRLADQARSLRLGDPAKAEIDVGPLISNSARERFDAFIKHAVAAGARILAGGEPLDGPGWSYRPTVLIADRDNTEAESALAGCFGPVVLLRGVADAEAAIAATNASEYGLTASVWGRDRRRARAIAERLQAGTVTINDAVAPLGHAAAPFGGTKASGFGRTHGVLGLREFAQPQAMYQRQSRGLRPQLFPYNSRIMLRGLELYRNWFHRTKS